MDVSSYVKHHRETLGLARQLQQKVQEAQPSVPEISRILIELAGTLKFHLSMEDKFVYPRAASSTNPGLQAIAKKMQTEMVGMSEACGKYFATWDSTAIADDMGRFAAETNRILAALKNRIDAEEHTFYPLVHEYL